MTDIFREVEEDLRRERAGKLWQQYGGLVISVAVSVVIGTAAYVGWKHWETGRRQENTEVLLQAARVGEAPPGGSPDWAASAKAWSDAAAKLSGFPAVAARFSAAAALIRQEKIDAAVAAYDSLAGSGDVPPVFRDLAQLLSVQLQLDTGDPGQLRGRLSALTGPEGAWRWTAKEMLGLLAVRTGDQAAARAAFRALADDPETPAGIRSRASDLASFYAAPDGEDRK